MYPDKVWRKVQLSPSTSHIILLGDGTLASILHCLFVFLSLSLCFMCDNLMLLAGKRPSMVYVCFMTIFGFFSVFIAPLIGRTDATEPVARHAATRQACTVVGTLWSPTLYTSSSRLLQTPWTLCIVFPSFTIRPTGLQTFPLHLAPWFLCCTFSFTHHS